MLITNNDNCAAHTCANGHKWVPQLAITHCNGCKQPVIALRMVNCPICNEPAKNTTLRVDYLGSAMPIVAKCKNERHLGPEYINVEISHKHTDWVAGNPLEKTTPTHNEVEAKNESA